MILNYLLVLIAHKMILKGTKQGWKTVFYL